MGLIQLAITAAVDGAATGQIEIEAGKRNKERETGTYRYAMMQTNAVEEGEPA